MHYGGNGIAESMLAVKKKKVPKGENSAGNSPSLNFFIRKVPSKVDHSLL